MINPQKSEQQPLTMGEITATAVFTVQALNVLGYRCYLFGSAACALYGVNHRTPHDVDVVVLPEDYDDALQIKDRLVKYSDRFFLQRSPIDNHAYIHLYFRLRRAHVGTNGRQSLQIPQRECKVDILLPEVLETPEIPPNHIVWRGNLPLAPLKTLILLKLHGWYKRHADHREIIRNRGLQDEVDVIKLLQFAMQNNRVVESDAWCSKVLHENAREWVTDFIAKRHSTVMNWCYLGYEINLKRFTGNSSTDPGPGQWCAGIRVW